MQKVISTGKAIFSVIVYSNYTGHVHEAGNDAKNVTVEIPDIPGKKFAGKISFQNPELNSATRINLLRTPVTNQGNQLKPGMSLYHCKNRRY